MSSAPNYSSLVQLLKIGRVFPDSVGWATLTEEQAEEIRSLGFSAAVGRWKSPLLPPELTRDTIFESLSIGWDPRRANAQPLPAGAGTRESVTQARQDGEPPVESVPLQPLHSVPRVPPQVEASVPDVEQQPDDVRQVGIIERADSREETHPAATSRLSRAGAPDQPPPVVRTAVKEELTELHQRILQAVERSGHIDKRLLQRKFSREKAERFSPAFEDLIAWGFLELQGLGKRKSGYRVVLCPECVPHTVESRTLAR